MTTKLTAEEHAVMRLLAQAAGEASNTEALFDALLEGLDAARERRKERWAQEREQEAAERKRQRLAWWNACQRNHDNPDQCGPECATPSDRLALNMREEIDRYGDPRKFTERERKLTRGY